MRLSRTKVQREDKGASARASRISGFSTCTEFEVWPSYVFMELDVIYTRRSNEQESSPNTLQRGPQSRRPRMPLPICPSAGHREGCGLSVSYTYTCLGTRWDQGILGPQMWRLSEQSPVGHRWATCLILPLSFYVRDVRRGRRCG